MEADSIDAPGRQSLAQISSLVGGIRRYSHRASTITGLDSLVTWCHLVVTQGCDRVRQFVHGGLEYQATLQRVQELEKQLEQLLEEKKALENSAATRQATTTSGECCSCSHCHKDTLPLPQDGDRQTVSHAQPGLAPPPPPPPAPPPPPPPPVRVPFKIVKKSTSQPDDKKVKDTRPVITAEELQKVKLRRPGERKQTSGEDDTSSKDCLEEGSLRRLALRKTQSAAVLRDVGNMLPIHVEDVTRQKRVLRKTTLKRSPGGTPLRDTKRRRESGQGLTPMMNKALRLRFQSQPVCQSSSDSEDSPFSSPDSSSSKKPRTRMSPLIANQTPEEFTV